MPAVPRSNADRVFEELIGSRAPPRPSWPDKPVVYRHNPMGTAKLLRASPDCPDLVFKRTRFYLRAGLLKVPAADVRCLIWKFLDEALTANSFVDGVPYPTRPFKPTVRDVANVMSALAALCHEAPWAPKGAA